MADRRTWVKVQWGWIGTKTCRPRPPEVLGQPFRSPYSWRTSRSSWAARTASSVVGSLLLGLYDDGGVLQHVGVSAAFPMKRRAELVEELDPLRMGDVVEHPWAAWPDEAAHETARLPGAPSRWSAKKDLSWVPLRPERVAEVAYDHMENGVRFRHTARFRRWRPDRVAESCTYGQLEEPVRYDLGEILPG